MVSRYLDIVLGFVIWNNNLKLPKGLFQIQQNQYKFMYLEFFTKQTHDDTKRASPAPLIYAF